MADCVLPALLSVLFLGYDIYEARFDASISYEVVLLTDSRDCALRMVVFRWSRLSGLVSLPMTVLLPVRFSVRVRSNAVEISRVFLTSVSS